MLGLLCGLTALILRLPFEPLLAGALPFIFFIPAAVIAAIGGGGIAVATCVAVVMGYFLTGAEQLTQFRPLYGVPFALFVATTTLVTLIARELRAAIDQLRSQEKILQDSEAHLHILVGELEHRVRNSLTLVGALVDMTARHSDSVGDFRARFAPRLEALANAQSVLTRGDWHSPDLETLIRQTLAPFIGTPGAGGAQSALTIVAGTPFQVPASSAVSLSLILHELATNALKHGAFAIPAGTVQLSWQVDDGGGHDTLDWVETGRAVPAQPERKGFGTDLFRALNVDAIRLERNFTPDGVLCRIVLKGA
jgi:two-component sensor histidine kinase